MLTAYLFDRERGARVDDWQASAGALEDEHVLWVDVHDPTDDERAALRTAFDFESDHPAAIRDGERDPAVRLHDGYIHVTSMTANAIGMAPGDAATVLESYVGNNWVVTSHAGDSPLIEEFSELATGAGQLGVLDASSFLATLLEYVVVSYADAFSEIEERLEEFDASVLKSADREVERKVEILVDARQRVGELRRSLVPHRRIFATLSHAELDLVSTESSANRFAHLASRVDDALAAARDAKDAVVNSFDMLILRTEHRTNEMSRC